MGRERIPQFHRHRAQRSRNSVGTVLKKGETPGDEAVTRVNFPSDRRQEKPSNRTEIPSVPFKREKRTMSEGCPQFSKFLSGNVMTNLISHQNYRFFLQMVKTPVVVFRETLFAQLRKNG